MNTKEILVIATDYPADSLVIETVATQVKTKQIKIHPFPYAIFFCFDISLWFGKMSGKLELGGVGALIYSLVVCLIFLMCYLLCNL